MKIHSDVQFIAYSTTQTGDTLHSIVDFAQMIDDLKLLGKIHFSGTKALVHGVLRRAHDICRSVTAYPGVNFYSVANLSTQQLVYRCVVVFALDVP